VFLLVGGIFHKPRLLIAAPGGWTLRGACLSWKGRS